MLTVTRTRAAADVRACQSPTLPLRTATAPLFAALAAYAGNGSWHASASVTEPTLATGTKRGRCRTPEAVRTRSHG
jgi:hypothetical protein